MPEERTFKQHHVSMACGKWFGIVRSNSAIEIENSWNPNNNGIFPLMID